ncbi:hypothetical protein RIVM261_061980 [Rivularia sp. IAM M-261]|nr:hypothetical protein RIVM261_061980 [Rivularia sp. IAM M-261]
MQRSPQSTIRCYQDLCTAPMTKKPRRVFTLRGRQYEGIWEYEVTSGDRVFYIPYEEEKKFLFFMLVNISNQHQLHNQFL